MSVSARAMSVRVGPVSVRARPRCVRGGCPYSHPDMLPGITASICDLVKDAGVIALEKVKMELKRIDQIADVEMNVKNLTVGL